MNFIQSIKDALANPKSQRGMNGKITVDRSVLIGLLETTETLDEANRNNHDTTRLDYLDQLNAEFNKRNSSNYGWRIEWNHNRIAEELQRMIDAIPDTHGSAPYEAEIIDKTRKPICTKYFHANSPEQARLKALKICRFDSGLKQVAYANIEKMGCRSIANS